MSLSDAHSTVWLCAVPSTEGGAIEALQLVAKRPGFRSFGDLAVLPAEPNWLWNDLLAPGLLTLLSGAAFGGKSTLVAALLRSMTTGQPLLGRGVRPGRAAVLTEEAAISVRDKAAWFGILNSQHRYAARSDALLRLGWEEMIAAATDSAIGLSADLLVIDTFTGLAGLGPELENDAAAVTAKLAALRSATGRGLAVLVLHHSNASGRPRGSTAFEGTADIVARMTRKRDTVKVHTSSRFTSVTLSGTLNDATPFHVVPEPTAEPVESGSRTDQRLRDVLCAAGAAGLTHREIGSHPGFSIHMSKRRTHSWKEKGWVGHHGTGAKNDPKRWFLLESVR